MLSNERLSLALYRLEKADVCIKDAELLLKSESYLSAVNRTYYAIFHSARALLALDGEDRKRHSGVISYFQENYIKSGRFPKIYSYIIQNAFEIRQETDYEDFYLISKDDALQQFENAKQFTNTMWDYINNQKNIDKDDNL